MSGKNNSYVLKDVGSRLFLTVHVGILNIAAMLNQQQMSYAVAYILQSQ